MSPLMWLGAGLGMVDFGGWLLWWSLSPGRRARRAHRSWYITLPPPSRYDEHLLRTDRTRAVYYRSGMIT